VSRQVRVRAMLVRTFPRVRGNGSFPALAGAALGSRNWPSIPSSQYRLFAWLDAEDDAKHWNMWSTRSLLLQPETWQTTGYGSPGIWLDRHPYIGAHQTSVSTERQFSRIFPAHPRSLASVLIPRAAARRVSASHSVRPVGFGFQKILCATNAKRFSEPSEKDAAWPWERGTLASLRARVSRGQSGQIQTGEKQWHSTPTPLL
jgi:hypothetical protein